MLIDIKNLYKIYNEGKESEVRALDGVSLSIDRGGGGVRMDSSTKRYL